MFYPKGNKYHARKVEVEGIKFDSQLEANRWYQLKLLERAGEITELDRQVKYEIVPKSKYGRALYYQCDFQYKDKNGNLIVEDTKSKATRTRLFLLKKRLVAERYGIVIQEVYK